MGLRTSARWVHYGAMKSSATKPAERASRTPTAQRDPNFVFALAKGLDILASFSGAEQLGNQDLVGRTGLPKATVSRLTSTLVQLGYLQVDPITRKLRIGSRLLGMGMSMQRNIGLHEVARPLMERLSRDTGLTVSFGTRDRLGLAFLEVIRPDDPRHLVTNTAAGSVLPLESTAIGLAYVVAAPVKERAEILQGLHRRHGGDWESVRLRIEQAHKDYVRHGFVVAQRSWGREVSAVAVPLLLPGQGALYSFHCAGPARALPAVRAKKEVGPLLAATVKRIADGMIQAERARSTPSEP